MTNKPVVFHSRFDDDPDFVNDLGVKWWLDKSLTEYATREDGNGIGLSDITIWCVEKPNGYKTHIMTQGEEALYENQKLEDMAVHVDILKLNCHFDEKDSNK